MSDLFAAFGPLAKLYRQVDWAGTALGEVSGWSPTLRAMIRMMARSKAAMTLLWGPEHVLLYNQPYAELIQDKHPAAVGRPTQQVFPEIWDDIAPLLDHVHSGAEGIWLKDAYLPLHRHGRTTESYFTYSYSAVPADDGSIEGVLDVVTETTAEVLSQRRLTMLTQLSDQLVDVTEPGEARDIALALLRAQTGDFSHVDIDLHAGAHLPSPANPLVRRDLTLTDDQDPRVATLRLITDRPSQDGLLTAHLNPHVNADTDFTEYLRVVAATLAQTLSRISARLNERRSAAQERAMSETLQRSLLTPPVQPDHLQVAVRYQPAMMQAQVGGDWYDSFLLPDGTLTVVVGDVSGHDRHSAAAMAQIRNLTRGIAFTLQKPPAQIMAAVDAAMTGLAVNVYATAIIAQVEQTDEQAAHGLRTLRWSNAGHPPPLLLQPDGTVRVLHTRPDIMLGTRHKITRADHTVTLQPGCSVIFYTDGLVERRDRPLDDGIELLQNMLAGHQARSADQICDLLLTHLGHTTEDDIVLAVIHAYPENQPRPPEAGPSVLPDDLRD